MTGFFLTLYRTFGAGHLLASITKTCLYSFDPLKPNFCTVKLGFTGVDIIFLISVHNIDCGYSLEPPRRGGSNEYPQSMFWAEIWKISEFFMWKLSFFDGKIFSIFEQACFRNGSDISWSYGWLSLALVLDVIESSDIFQNAVKLQWLEYLLDCWNHWYLF